MPSDAEVLRHLVFSNRPVFLYGAGYYGGMVLAMLESMGLDVPGFLDSDPARHNTIHAGKPVFPFTAREFDPGKCNVVLTMLGGSHLGIVSRLIEHGVPGERIFTNLLAWYRPPGDEATGNYSLDRHLELYMLSRHLSADGVSAELFRLRHRHAVLGDRPYNPGRSGKPEWGGHALVASHDAPIPDSPRIRYPTTGALWWDLLYRREAFREKEVAVEFANQSGALVWRIAFLALNDDRKRLFSFRYGREKGQTVLSILPGGNHES